MKILYVSHYYLPKHQAGTEIYTYTLAKAMGKHHEIVILTSEDADLPPGEFQVEKDEYDGIPVYRILRGEPIDFRASYRDDRLDAIFSGLIDEIQPQIVHFQHLYRLSAGFIEVLHKKSIPRVLTLADYWFICPPITLLRPGFVRCPGPDKGVACANCGNAIGESFAGSYAAKLVGANQLSQQASQVVHKLKNALPEPVVKFAKDVKDRAVANSPTSGRRMDLLSERYNYMIDIMKKVNLIIAPSRYLRETHVDAGVPATIVSYSDYGFDDELFPRKPRKPYSPPLKVGYVGTIVEHKGVHVLVDAMKKVKGAQCRIWGDLSHFPNYVKKLKKEAAGATVEFMDRFDHKDVANILAEIDVLVVPSLWYENSPLTIHEAFLAGVPVLASRAGGMGELVADPMFLFETGDAAELAGLIQGLVNNPRLLNTFGNRRSEVKTIDENVFELEEIYEIIISKHAEEGESGPPEAMV